MGWIGTGVVGCASKNSHTTRNCPETAFCTLLGTVLDGENAHKKCNNIY